MEVPEGRDKQGGRRKGLRENVSAGQGAVGPAHATCTGKVAPALPWLIQKSRAVRKMND